MLTFDEFIRESASYPLFELSSNSTMYHRSMHKFKVGDIIKPMKNKTGEHWLQSNSMEVALENLRQERYSDKPSRFNCIYTTVVPRSRFVDKGYLYTVRPLGNFFMTDSKIIDEMDGRFSSNLNDYFGEDWKQQSEVQKLAKNGDKRAIELLTMNLPYEANRYWTGIRSLRGRIQDIEILCDSVIVTEFDEDKDRLKVGDKIVITDEKITGSLDLYFNSKANSSKEFTFDEITKMVNDITKNIFVNPKIDKKTYTKKGGGINGSDEHVYTITGTLRKNTKLEISFIKNEIYNKHYDPELRKNTKYTDMMFNFYLGRKLYRRTDQSPLFRFSLYNYGKEKLHDVSQYMKKIS